MTETNILYTTNASVSSRFHARSADTQDRVRDLSKKSGNGPGLVTGDETSVASVRFEPRLARAAKAGRLDPRLLDRAGELLDGIEHSPPETMTLSIESLKTVISQLWVTAGGATQYHHSILAIMESSLLSAEQITQGLAAALRGAVKDLGCAALSETHVEIVRSQFIDEGHNPLSILSGFKDDEPE